MIQLKIGDQVQEFVPISMFRAQFGLPETFGISTFIDKDTSELGSIERAGEALQKFRHIMIDSLPSAIPAYGWQTEMLLLQLKFSDGLNQINNEIGLQPSEIQYAVTGFGEICQMIVYDCLQARLRQTTPTPFIKLYSEWVNRTVQVSNILYLYEHQGQQWYIQAVQNAYGRIGLMIRIEDHTHYVYDGQLACPAGGFMAALCAEVARAVQAAFVTQQKPPVHLMKSSGKN